MRNFGDIVTAVRAGQSVTEAELRYAVAAADVLLYRLDLELDPVRLQEYFTACATPVDQYLGENNTPDRPANVAWYREMIGAGPSCICTRCGRPGHAAADCPWPTACESNESEPER